MCNLAYIHIISFQVKALPSAEQQLEEKEALAKANAAAGIKPPERIAPIIQYIKAAQTKSAAKAAAGTVCMLHHRSSPVEHRGVLFLCTRAM